MRRHTMQSGIPVHSNDDDRESDVAPGPGPRAPESRGVGGEGSIKNL